MLYRKWFAVLSLFVIVALLLGACQPVMLPDTTSIGDEVPALPEGGASVSVNDIAMYYEIHGEGEPLLLMPSGMWNTEDFAGLTEVLAQEYQVIVMDARGRGRSTDSGKRLDIAIMADDIVALMDELGIEKAHLVGWADSAIVGLEMAMRYPERVDKLVAYAPNYTVEGLTEEHRAWLKSLSMEDLLPMFSEAYDRLAPDPSYLPLMLTRLIAMFLTEPNYTLAQLSQITAPTLILDGENDEFIVRTHLEEMAAAIPNAELAFMPGLSHYAPYEDPVAWTEAVLTFLKEPVDVTAYPVPRFEAAECKYPVLADANAECGYLVVREDRANPASPTTRIHVIKFLSASATPNPDPIIVLPGGPGASGPFYAWMWSAMPVGEVMRAERDVYILEPRGAMYAEPAFYCPEMEAEVATMVGMSMAEEIAWSADAYRACHDRLIAAGANLSAYGFVEIAHDVADLSAVLGLDTVNLYGVSYGTTPAMLAMREHPQMLRSVILDSVIPPDAVYVEQVLANSAAAFDTVFAACAADPICNAEYPDLDVVFADVLNTLRTTPASVVVAGEDGQEYTVTVDDVKFVHFAYDTIFIGDGYTALPASIFAAQAGDLNAPAGLWLGYVAGRHGPITPEAGAWAKGMTYSAMCLQDGSVTDVATTSAIFNALETLPTLHDWGLTYWLGEALEPCEYWAVTSPVPNLAVEPVVSDLPTLMLEGIFDPESPPSLSRPSAANLANSFYIELPAAHALLFTDCGLELMTQFLADPTQAPDASCIDEMTPNWLMPD